MPMPSDVRTVPARVDLAVTEWPSDGPPLVLLHGIGSSAYTWRPVAPRLARHYHLYAVDMRGHGDSAKPDTGYLLDDYAEDLDALLDALELDRPYVLGHSLGSLTALTWASRHPGRAAAMALEDPPLRTVPEILDAFDGWMALNAMTPEDLAAHYAVEYPHWTPEERLGRARMMAATHPAVFAELRADAARNLAAGTVERLDSLAALDTPTLLMMGDLEAGSMTAPADARRLAGLMPNTTIHRIPGAGHSIHRDWSDDFVAAVTAFFGT